MKRLIFAGFSVFALSAVGLSAAPAHALTLRFETAHRNTLNTLTDRFQKEHQQTIDSRLTDRFQKEHQQTINSN